MLPHSNTHTYYYAIDQEPNIPSFLFPPPASLREHSSVTINPPATSAAAEEKRATGESPELPLPCRRKYRRSKICTAQGLRDRRMRLSLDVAGKFFGLQDLLGFDRASKTVQWLLSKSKHAIRELAMPAAREARPAAEEEEEEREEDYGVAFAAKAEQRSSIVVKSLRTRESRKEARERARLRTLEKKRMKSDECCGGGLQDHEEITADRDNASAALLFDYDYQTVDCLFEQETWEMDFRVNFDEGVLLDW